MTTKTRRQVAVLAALVVALAVVNVMRRQPAPAGAPSRPSNPVSGTTGTRRQPPPQAPVADVKLEALTAPRDDAAEPTERNLFRFQVKAPPPAPPRAALPPPGPVQPEPVVPQGPPPPPPIPLRLIGLLNAPTQAGRVAVFSDGRGNSLNGREGDIIEGRYRLLRINADSVELAYTDGRGRQVIRLAGQ
jgi:hypothetical protein